jgi:hypothetical protein
VCSRLCQEYCRCQSAYVTFLCADFDSHYFQHAATKAHDDEDEACDEDEDLWVLIEETDEVFEGFRQLMDALMSTYKEPCVAFAQALVLPTLGEFLSKPLFGPEIKSTAINLMNSIVKHGGIQGSGLVPQILPLWIAASQEENADVRTTALYGIGICAMSNPDVVNQGLAHVWQVIQQVLGKKTEMVTEHEEHVVWDNALSTAFRLFRAGLVTDPSIYNSLLGLLPMNSDDVDEAAAVVDMVVAVSDRIRPAAGLRSLAEQQVKLLVDKHENFQQVRIPFSNTYFQKNNFSHVFPRSRSKHYAISFFPCSLRCFQFVCTFIVDLFRLPYFDSCHTSGPICEILFQIATVNRI